MSQQQSKRADKKIGSPAPISVTYDTNQDQVIILCDDGTLWRRRCVLVDGGLSSSWEKIDEFLPE